MQRQVIKTKIQETLKYYFFDLPLWMRISFASLFGVFFGLVIFLIHISNFFSYLSDNPKTCINCHIMVPQYVTWSHSAHREVATCNDCHVPHDNVVHQYLFKAQDGLRHSTIFTMRTEPQAIIIKSAGRDAVQQNCLRCHSKLVNHYAQDRLCWDCHREVPHGRERSLSSTPYGKAPTTKSMIPDWLQVMMDKPHKKEERK